MHSNYYFLDYSREKVFWISQNFQNLKLVEVIFATLLFYGPKQN